MKWMNEAVKGTKELCETSTPCRVKNGLFEHPAELPLGKHSAFAEPLIGVSGTPLLRLQGLVEPVGIVSDRSFYVGNREPDRAACDSAQQWPGLGLHTPSLRTNFQAASALGRSQVLGNLAARYQPHRTSISLRLPGSSPGTRLTD